MSYPCHRNLTCYAGKIVNKEVDSLGDTSTLADPSVVDVLISKVADLQK